MTKHRAEDGGATPQVPGKAISPLRRRPLPSRVGAKRSIITVGGGRGFVIDACDGRSLVVTAAHCLPQLPPAMNFSTLGERTYPGLLGPLGNAGATVWAECLFVDPVADIAVLGPPDSQELSEQCEAYEAFIQDAKPIKMAAAASNGPAWLFSLEGQWTGCHARHNGGPLWVFAPQPVIQGGMSGSPVVDGSGMAIGVCTTGNGEVASEGMGPRLGAHLPRWLVANLIGQPRPVRKREKTAGVIHIVSEAEVRDLEARPRHVCV